MQLLRSNVSPETRPEVFKALVCIAYLVSLPTLSAIYALVMRTARVLL